MNNSLQLRFDWMYLRTTGVGAQGRAHGKQKIGPVKAAKGKKNKAGVASADVGLEQSTLDRIVASAIKLESERRACGAAHGKVVCERTTKKITILIYE